VTTAIAFRTPRAEFLPSEARETHRGSCPLTRCAAVNLSVVRRDKAKCVQSREGEMPVDFEATRRQCWGMAQRIGIQIAELPLRARDAAFAGAEGCLRAAGNELGVAGQQLDSVVALQMRAIRQIVADTNRRAERHRQGA
jgi:hypothetical protein